MISLARTSTERAHYMRALRFPREMELRIEILDRNEKPRASLTAPASQVIDGYVAVDARADVSRSLSLTLLDRNGRLQLDPASPSPTALFPDQMVRVVRRDYVEAIEDWVDCPVFWGPFFRFERTSDGIVQIEGVGKEALARSPAVLWRTMNYRKGTRVTTIIRDILRVNGETRFDLIETTKRVPTAQTFTRHDDAWPAAVKLARSANRQLFYDGRGRVRMRAHPSRVLHTFYAIDLPKRPEPTVLTHPRVAFDFSVMRNTIEVLGPEPKKGQKRIRYVATPTRNDPLSPWSLARNGKPRYIVETIQNDKLKRVADARALANRVLKDRLRVGVQVDFEALPVPVLEEGDLVALVTREGRYEFRLTQFTIPLTAAGTMSVGTLRRPRIARRRR